LNFSLESVIFQVCDYFYYGIINREIPGGKAVRKKISIALVDDNPISRKLEREKLKGVLELENFRGIHFTIPGLGDGKELMESGDIYDLILMDYEMPQMNGIETAIQLSKDGVKSKILFLSGYDEIVEPLQQATSIKLTAGFIFKSDSVHQFQYEVERVIRDILDISLVKIKYYSEEWDIDIEKLKKVFYEAVIDGRKIVMIESQNEVVFVYGENDEEFSTDTPLKDWLSKLPEGDFVNASKSCLVNLRYVKSYNSKLIMLTTDEDVKLGRYYKKAFILAYENYMMREAMK